MTCREKTSFRPDEPKYHRLLIDLLGRAQQYTAFTIKREGQGDDASQVAGEKADEEIEARKSEHNQIEEDSEASQLEEELPLVNPHVPVKLEEEPEFVDEKPDGIKREP